MKVLVKKYLVSFFLFFCKGDLDFLKQIDEVEEFVIEVAFKKDGI